MTDYYLRSDAAGGGNGLSDANAFNSVSQLPANLSGHRIYCKRGSVFYNSELLLAATASDWLWTDYGDALNAPIFDGSKSASTGWSLYSGTTFQNSGLTDNYLFYGVEGGRLPYAVDLAECLATPLTQFFSGGVLYANLGETSPDFANLRIWDKNYGIQFQSGTYSDFELSRIHFTRYSNALPMQRMGNGVLLSELKMSWSGSDKNNGGWGMVIGGVSDAARASDVTFQKSIIHDTTFNAIEVWFMDRVHFYKNQLLRCDMGFEIWAGVKGLEITANYAEDIGFSKITVNDPTYARGGHANFVWAPYNNSVNHENIKIKGNIANRTRSSTMDIGSCIGVEVDYNTFYQWGLNVESRCVVLRSAGGGTVSGERCRNNIMARKDNHTPGYYAGFMEQGNVTFSEPANSIDRNIYWNNNLNGTDNFLAIWNNVLKYQNFTTNYKAAALANAPNAQETNSLRVDPLFVDPDNGDFRLQPGSPALGMGANSWQGNRGRPACLHSDVAGTYYGGALDDSSSNIGAVQDRMIP